MNHTKNKKPSVHKTPKRAMTTKKAKVAKPSQLAKAAPHKMQMQSMMTINKKAPMTPAFLRATSMSAVPMFAAATPTTTPAMLTTPFNAFNMPSVLNTPFTMARRGIIHKPKTPLDNDTELRMDFTVLKASEPIVEMEDDQYPEWIWTVADLQPSLYELSKVPEEEMTIEQVRRKFKLDRRGIIKGNNTAQRK